MASKIEAIKALIGSALVLAGAFGVVFPEDSLPALNDAISAVGALVLLFSEHVLPLPADGDS